MPGHTCTNVRSARYLNHHMTRGRKLSSLKKSCRKKHSKPPSPHHLPRFILRGKIFCSFNIHKFTHVITLEIVPLKKKGPSRSSKESSRPSPGPSPKTYTPTKGYRGEEEREKEGLSSCFTARERMSVGCLQAKRIVRKIMATESRIIFFFFVSISLLRLSATVILGGSNTKIIIYFFRYFHSFV